MSRSRKNAIKPCNPATLPDSIATNTRDHQIRIQYHWQRGELPNPGGLMDTGNSTDTRGHAPGNERSGIWVRVAEAATGANHGASFTPRIGTQVLVDFLNNDIDQPVIVASLYNGVDTPPFAAGWTVDWIMPGWCRAVTVRILAETGLTSGCWEHLQIGRD